MKPCEEKATLALDEYRAVIFDLDGVITQTEKLHQQAWKEMFDDYLQKRYSGTEESRPFDIYRDYRLYVNGMPREDGVRSFLESRKIEIPYGSYDDGPEKETICGLGKRKNILFHHKLENEGVKVYASTVELILKLKEEGVKVAVVSSSENCADVLEAANIADIFDTRVDGRDLKKLGLKGKPAPDIFLEAARRLDSAPENCAIVEDAVSGVRAGREGKFGCVIGVARKKNAAMLRENGARIVVSDLSEIARAFHARSARNLPSAIDHMEELKGAIRGKRVALFLDYDGTLTPIVLRPELAVLSNDMRELIERLSEKVFLAIISGRDLSNIRKIVGLSTIYYGGSHGFEISGPGGMHFEYEKGADFLPALGQAEHEIRSLIREIPGAHVERKRFSVAVHFREVEEGRIGDVERHVDETLKRSPGLRKSHGKKVFEIQPDLDWNKGKALLWLMKALSLDGSDIIPFYIGDDVTDEDAFRALRDRGIGIVVGEETRDSAARYRLRNPEEVGCFLQILGVSMR